MSKQLAKALISCGAICVVGGALFLLLGHGLLEEFEGGFVLVIGMIGIIVGAWEGTK